MTTYLTLLIVVCLVGVIAAGMASRLALKFSLVVCAVATILVIGLRAPTVGTDTLNYAAQYALKVQRDDEWGYALIANTLSNAGVPFQLFVLGCAAVSVGAWSYAYGVWSDRVWQSYYLYVTLGPFALAMTGLRQTLAVSVGVIAIVALSRGRRIVFVTLVAAAFTLHNSAIVLLPLVLVGNVRLTRKRALLVMAVAAILSTQSGLASWAVATLGLDGYELYFSSDTSINPLLVLVALVVPAFCVIFWPEEASADRGVQMRVYSLLFILASANLAFAGLALEVPMAIRMTYYFGSFATILIPNAISRIEHAGTRLFAHLGTLSLAGTLFILSTPGSSLGLVPYDSILALGGAKA